jgi:DNA mismatch repair protein MutL
MEMRSKPISEPVIKVNPDYNPFHSTASRPISSGNSSGRKSENFSTAINKQAFGTKEAKASDWENFYSIEETEKEEEIAPLIEEDTTSGISQYLIKGNYIFTPSKSGFMVIHARRAYEQILYTELINSFINNPIDSQSLLFPIEKELSKEEITAWQSNTTMLNQLGFIGEIKDGDLHLSAVPSVLQDETIQKALDRIIETIAHRDIEKGEIAHELVHSIAKSAALKKMNLNTMEAVNNIIERLFQCENHSFTPGNKQIIDTLSLESIDEKFR